jgi:hypothetical protein
MGKRVEKGMVRRKNRIVVCSRHEIEKGMVRRKIR